MAARPPSSPHNDPSSGSAQSVREDDSLVHILVVEDDQGSRPIALDAVTLSLGRDLSNSIVLHSTSISRQHAMILRVPNPRGGYLYQLMDGNSEGKASSNGTFLNGQRCRKALVLKDGDVLTFGTNSGVKACYYLRSPHDEELGQFIQSVKHRSVKAAISDPKATILQRLDGDSLTEPPSLGSEIKPDLTPSKASAGSRPAAPRGFWGRLGQWLGQMGRR